MPGEAEKLALKAFLKNTCLNLLQERVQHADLAVRDAQSSANSQEKSSVGDKYETARAMGQIDRDLNANQLIKAREEYSFLENIAVNITHDQVVPGTVVQLEKIICFAAVGLGALRAGNKKVIAISCSSPLFHQLKGKRRGDLVVVNGIVQKISDVY